MLANLVERSPLDRDGFGHPLREDRSRTALENAQVRAPDDAAYEELLRTLTEDEAVEVLLTSPRRRLIATGDLPEGSRHDIAAMGGEISEDEQYDLEHPG